VPAIALFEAGQLEVAGIGAAGNLSHRPAAPLLLALVRLALEFCNLPVELRARMKFQWSRAHKRQKESVRDRTLKMKKEKVVRRKEGARPIGRPCGPTPG
jgi:hypothetical protein